MRLENNRKAEIDLNARIDQNREEFGGGKLEQEAKAGIRDAQFLYGIKLFNEGNLAESYKWLERASIAGETNAKTFLTDNGEKFINILNNKNNNNDSTRYVPSHDDPNPDC